MTATEADRAAIASIVRAAFVSDPRAGMLTGSERAAAIAALTGAAEAIVEAVKPIVAERDRFHAALEEICVVDVAHAETLRMIATDALAATSREVSA